MHKFSTAPTKSSTLPALHLVGLLNVPYSTFAGASVARLVRSALSSLRDENLCIIRARRSVMRSLLKKTPRTPNGLRFSGGAKRRPTQPLVRRRPRNHESVHSRLFSKVYPEVGLQQYSVLLLIPYLPFLTSLSGRHDQTAIGQRDTPVRCRQ